jgi:FKBP-type peptidyl-prolyl cis-trans isomerase 2
VLNATSVYNVKGQDIDGVEFVVSGFNATNGTFEISQVDTTKGYNGELAGRTLFFEVTIVKVTAA